MLNQLVAVFWGTLAILFAVLAWKTHKTRKVVLPNAIQKARAKAVFESQNVGAMEPVFKDMLLVETIALILTVAAAIITAVTYIYSI